MVVGPRAIVRLIRQIRGLFGRPVEDHLAYDERARLTEEFVGDDFDPDERRTPS
jgi:hypothetical protein